MQQTTSTTSERVDDDSSAPSVLDFLYHDSRRIGSFLSQFEGDGQLQQLTRTKAGTRGRVSSTGEDLKLSARVLSGGKQEKIDTSLSMNEGYARVFDPYWSNARAFLDFINDRGLLVNKVASAEIGQFIISKGLLTILDLATLKQLWDKPAIQKRVLSGIDQSKPLSQMTKEEKKAFEEAKLSNEVMLDFMKVAPHSVHASMLTHDEPISMVWGSLRDEYLTTPASDLTLMHGHQIAGEWSIVGILNAKPDFVVPELDGNIDQSEVGTLSSLVGQISAKMAPIMRVTLGRPAFAHAVTPLLIFRTVA